VTSHSIVTEDGSREYVEEYVEYLTDAYPDVQEVWLFGSRANDTARPDSDWDLLVWSNEDHLLNKLSRNKRFRRAGIDLFVVVGRWAARRWPLVGQLAVQPWPADDGQPKQLWLDDRAGGLNWQYVTSFEARYIETKDLKPGSFQTVSRERIARLLYRGRVTISPLALQRSSR
jgi:hypothetical protein